MRAYTRHHVIPRSRCAEFGINDPDFDGNVMIKPRTQHEAYHTLFGNATPLEAIEILKQQWITQEAQKILKGETYAV